MAASSFALEQSLPKEESQLKQNAVNEIKQMILIFEKNPKGKDVVNLMKNKY
ncbi:hypothetical protein [Leptospira terpstrae]|uniref:hypothetical protein n=1 Tax=Leptospira terpstrae TaxID=293075 RepID=UPI0002DB9811|nr:hypothetical protein [Leptospira terpstrae]